MNHPDTAVTSPATNGNADAPIAMLASLSFHLPRQQRLNREKTAEIEEQAHAAPGTGRFSVNYFQQEIREPKVNKLGELIYKGGKQVMHRQIVDALGPLKSFHNAWRKMHMDLTRVWDLGGVRLLIPARVKEYLEMSKMNEARWPALRDEFLKNQPDWEVTAPERMGSLSPGDFPSLEECRKDLWFSLRIVPCAPDEQWKHILKDMPDIADEMIQKNAAYRAQAKEEIRRETWHDLLDPLQNMVNVLAKDRARLFETLLSNLSRVLDLAPAYNNSLIHDPAMDTYIANAKELLAGVTIDQLREDPELRQEMHAKASALLIKSRELGERKMVMDNE